MNGLLAQALRAPALANAFRVSLCVGTVLNVVNQGWSLFSLATLSWPHLVLNYLVPFLVASYSGARMAVHAREEDLRG